MRTSQIPSIQRGVLAAICILALAALAQADGTETLGPPSIPIAAGTGVVASGTGLQAGPGTIEIEVPGEIVQVLLYWEGQMSADDAGDDVILLDGTAVNGTLIGGQTYLFQDAYSSAFRADITALGIVESGANTLEVAGCDFTKICNGAGLMVIYDDGSGVSEIDLRDGVDWAYFIAPEPRRTAVPQTFSFDPTDVDRTATLNMFFSSVVGSVSTGGPIRPSEIVITSGGVTTSLVNVLNSGNGEEWDTITTTVTVPAGADTLTIAPISTESDEPLGASLTWTAASISIPRFQGGQGCTPGYWKQPHHWFAWTAPYAPETPFAEVFADAFPGKTLLEVAGQGGGGLKALGRHTVAALLNAASTGTDYDLTVNEVVEMFDEAFRNGDLEILKDHFEFFNEQGCPLGNGKTEGEDGGNDGAGRKDAGDEGDTQTENEDGAEGGDSGAEDNDGRSTTSEAGGDALAADLSGGSSSGGCFISAL